MMENTQANPEMHRCCGRSRFGVVRCLVSLLLLGLAFAAGATTARMHDFRSMGMRNHLMVRNGMPMGQEMSRMMPESGMMREEHEDRMMMGGGRMMVMERKGGMNATGTMNMVNVFGAITKIEGNKITVMDNGAKEQTVLSQASTRISSAMGFMNLSMLKVGQTTAIVASTGADGALMASTIRLY